MDRRWSRVGSWVVVAMGCTWAASCEVGCTTLPDVAIALMARDSVTGELLPASPDVILLVRRIDRRVTGVDTLEAASGGTPFSIFFVEQAGTYDLELRAGGYLPWIREGIRVEHDGCHPITQDITALMVPEGSAGHP